MKRFCPYAVALVFVILLTGCDPAKPFHRSVPPATQPDSHAIQPPPNSNSPPSGLNADRYDGPPVVISALALQTYPEQNVITVQTTVPTGGWKLSMDKGEVMNGTARVYLTLEKPAKDEWVTQSLQTLSASYKTTTKFTTAEAYVFVSQRGVETFTTNYRLAATSK